jgi:uncharacterized protein YbjT (DUF2867 family)
MASTRDPPSKPQLDRGTDSLRQPPTLVWIHPSSTDAISLPSEPEIFPAAAGGSQPDDGVILVTGATGYVGGRLVPALLDAGYRVRCLVRQPRKLDERRWRQHPLLEVVAGDLDDAAGLRQAMAGCRAASYLVHSMVATGGTYAERDRQLAANFGTAAHQAGLERIIYLGGLGEMGADLSEHLRSRRQVEETLAASGVPVTTFRAAMIIGAGSASFEILRYLVERLPIMVTPRWVTTECQPVAIADVLYWLTRCLEVPETAGQTLEIGGADVMPYRDLMKIMAEELGIPRRIILPVPVLTPRLSSLWINLVTPVSYRIAKPLAEGLKNRVVVTNDTTQRLMPHQPLGVREAIRRALAKIELHDVETRWSVAGPVPGDPSWAGGTVFTDERSVEIEAEPPQVYAAVCRIGGGNGWYAGDILWRLRGWMDTLVGGPGLRRGRRNPETVEFGETLDFWRVVDLNRDSSLSLRAEMKLPGEAQLDFRIEPIDENADQPLTRLVMTARYRPRGLLGLLYWYAVVPLHELVFGGMLRGIRKTAEAMRRAAVAGAAAPPPSDVAPGYGRARLWLGMSGVGTFVVLASAGLLFEMPARLLPDVGDTLARQITGLLLFVAAYAALHLPFDIFGGYLLPRWYRREHPPLPAFLLGLARGVAVHSAVLAAIASGLLLAGRAGGVAGVVVAAAGIVLLLLRGRVAVASAEAPLELTPSTPALADEAAQPVTLTYMAESDDEGFTGAIVGVLRPRLLLVPMRWRKALDPDAFAGAMRRRQQAIETGGWWRGRLVAIGFTIAGVALAATIVGNERLASAEGIVSLSLLFTLWSFLGLLVLPTPSRRGVADVDRSMLAAGCSRAALERTIRQLDDLQDRERERPPVIETIFHPVPSVESRLRGPHTSGIRGAWDAARTAVYLSGAGLGLLGRAVHCNCGRPSLWAFLPID